MSTPPDLERRGLWPVECWHGLQPSDSKATGCSNARLALWKHHEYDCRLHLGAVLDSPQGDAATWYYLWADGPSGNVIQQWYQASAVCIGATCSITPATTLNSGAHVWWVQTWNPTGYGPWSSGMNFTVGP